MMEVIGLNASRLVLKRSLSTAATHTVFNQSTPLQNINVFKSDPALVDSVKVFGGTHTNHLNDFGMKSGQEDIMTAAELAEKNKPTLRQFDNYGRRIDVAEYHDAYHKIMKHGLENGCAGHGFKHNTTGSHVTRAALIYMENQLEPGHCCPIVMTAAAIPVFQRYDGVQQYADQIINQKYDPRNVPMAEKTGITIGMSMTEKQGGSDVRANTTTAVPLGNNAFSLTGHKWFTSAPMCDAFLTLAKIAPDGNTSSAVAADPKIAPSCFLVPRWVPTTGERNTGFQVMRLKDKLGDRANASSEVEYRGAWGQLVGEPGKGVKTIIEMVQSTRLDCALGSAGAARRALQLALNHANGRKAFGHKLIHQPLMRNLLADLCVESEAHTMNAMYMARAFDRYYTASNTSSNTSSAEEIETEKELFRIGVSVSKYFVTKRLPGFVYECMEALGGNGYVEDFPMARLFRQSPLNAIWEGSGNVIALDILRGHAALPILLKDIQQVRGSDSRLDAYVAQVESAVNAVRKDPLSVESQRGARNLVDRLALALQASILVRYGDKQVAEAFLASRIPSAEGAAARGANFGGYAVYSEALTDSILARNMPVFEA